MQKELYRKKIMYMQKVIDFFIEKYTTQEVIRLGNLMGIGKERYWSASCTGEELSERFVSLVFRLDEIDEMLKMMQEENLYRNNISELIDAWESFRQESGIPHNSEDDNTVSEREKNVSEQETIRKKEILQNIGEKGIHLKEDLTAVVIGVEEYLIGAGENNLIGASKDVKELAAFLEYNWNIPKEKIHMLVGSVSKSELLGTLRRVCAGLSEKDKLLFYYAGHSHNDDDHAYLVVSDSVYCNGKVNKSIPLMEINEIIRNCKANIKIRIFDSMVYGKKATKAFEEEAFSAGDGWITFMPCSVGEEAFELQTLKHGVFSYFLLEGLKGGARRGTGRVYLEDLKIYLSNSVPEYVKNLGLQITQNPQYHCEVKGNIFID